MHGYAITKDGAVIHAELFPTREEAAERLTILRTEWPEDADCCKIVPARIDTDLSAEDVRDRIDAVYRLALERKISIVERMTQLDDLHDHVRAVILKWTDLLPGWRALSLLRIAIGDDETARKDRETNLLRTIGNVLDLSDPEDVDDAFEDAHEALVEVRKTYWAENPYVAEYVAE